jgi:fructose-1,6-bisphosphatase/inositol monophosphatase family enzyme
VITGHPIEPIDSTRAFMTGVPQWGVLIGLHDGAAPVLGVMDQPPLPAGMLPAAGLASAFRAMTLDSRRQ